jgi:hypothetical protein
MYYTQKDCSFDVSILQKITLILYSSQAIKLDNFIENRYDALQVLQSAEAKLEEYAEQCKATDQGTIHLNNNLSVDSCDIQGNMNEKQNPMQQTEESPTTYELQQNGCKENYTHKISDLKKGAQQNQAVRDNEESNTNFCCTSTDTQKNSNNSLLRDSEITIKTDPQITVITELDHQMSTSYTKDTKCKCRDSFVLQSSRESQTEIATKSSEVQTERINSVSMGIQCDLFLDNCEGKLEAPESQESFHSVVSELDTEITNSNDKELTNQPI